MYLLTETLEIKMANDKTFPVDAEVPRLTVPIMSLFPKGFPFDMALDMIGAQNMSSMKHGFPPPFKIVEGGVAVSQPYMEEMAKRNHPTSD